MKPKLTLEELGWDSKRLSTRTKKGILESQFKHHGYATYMELAKAAQELLSYKNIGKKVLAEVEDYLRKDGLDIPVRLIDLQEHLEIHVVKGWPKNTPQDLFPIINNLGISLIEAKKLLTKKGTFSRLNRGVGKIGSRRLANFIQKASPLDNWCEKCSCVCQKIERS